jgi:hypothetical protein
VIGELEVSLWRLAVESADALAVYLDWLLIHDPVRGELVHKRVHGDPLTAAEREQEFRAWSEALGLDGAQVCEEIVCGPLPRALTIHPARTAPLEAVLAALPFLEIRLVPDVSEMFDSIDAFRARCGRVTVSLESCPICSAIPDYCDRTHVSSIVADYEADYGEDRGHDHLPAQVAQLETFIAATREPLSEGGRNDEAVMRCPTCRRLYLYVDRYQPSLARSYMCTSYKRMEADALFRARCCVSWRLGGRDVAQIHPFGFFPHHAIVRFRDSRRWSSLDDQNRLVELTSAGLPRLIASDPPASLDDPVRARWYATFVGEVEDPELRYLDSFSELRWRSPLSDEDRDRVEAASAALRIDEPSAEQVADHVVVRMWVVSRQRLICRVVTVRETGETRCDDAELADLPVA